jgi:hypothetical protein
VFLTIGGACLHMDLSPLTISTVGPPMLSMPSNVRPAYLHPDQPVACSNC